MKRLSANDTLANGSHQAGPYFPRQLIFDLFPSLNKPERLNPKQTFNVNVDSHGSDTREVTATWYNNKLHGGTRNETRLTNWGGKESPLLDPDNTGALVVFAFQRNVGSNANECRVWVCKNEFEENIIEDQVGPVDPGTGTTWSIDGDRQISDESGSCWLSRNEIPAPWLSAFPSGEEIIRLAVEKNQFRSETVDERLLLRRACEFQIFRSIENESELPGIRQGFQSLEDFLARAQSILQRRKARSGHSLELHVKTIFVEEELVVGTDFDHQPETESGRKPDFLFPSAAAYRDPLFPDNRLSMLAVKTTCKDRWRQILDESARIRIKHLLTLQEGVSENQFRQMKEANVQLVVPQRLISKYPESIRSELLTFNMFLNYIKAR